MAASAVDTTESKIHPLPPPFRTSPENFDLITQGAEALVYKTTFLTPDTVIALKVRPAKAWRHPTLDKRLTRQRILAEARVLVKCRREGVPVPAVLGMDWDKGWLAGEWIEGRTVKEAIWQGGRDGDDGDGKGLRGLLAEIGKVVGKLHSTGVIHGDLTTSNMILRLASSGSGGLEGEVVLIDFGLATQTVQEEDRAVDLYVLERAFGSTHPRVEGLFGLVLEAYGEAFKGGKSTLRRLEDVRMRGRKKSMIG